MLDSGAADPPLECVQVKLLHLRHTDGKHLVVLGQVLEAYNVRVGHLKLGYVAHPVGGCIKDVTLGAEFTYR
jgi:hypothetical protein